MTNFFYKFMKQTEQQHKKTESESIAFQLNKNLFMYI